MKLVIFDCDGTLVDSQHGIVKSMSQAFEAEGLSPPPREAILGGVGLSLVPAVLRLAPELDHARAERVVARYRSEFRGLRLEGTYQEPLYDGMFELVQELSARDDHLLGVATGKSLRGVKALFERFDFDQHFTTVQTADTHPSKPHPSMIETAMREAGCAAERTVMIGDTTFDMEMAGNAGVHAVGVNWGYHPAGHLSRSGAVQVAGDGQELLSVIDAVLDDTRAV